MSARIPYHTTLAPVTPMSLTGVRNDRRLVILLLATAIAAAACGSLPGPGASPLLPPLALYETRVRPFEVVDFDAVHRPVDADGNAAVIFGALPVTPAATGTAPELAAFLGRWEGYGYGPPIKRDWRHVLAHIRGASGATMRRYGGQ